MLVDDDVQAALQRQSISIQTKKGAVTDTFENNSFSSVANKIYQTLMAISVL